MNPQQILRNLADYWPIIAELYKENADGIIIEASLLKVIRAVAPPTSKKDKTAREMVVDLEQSRILEHRPRGQQGWEWEPGVLQMVEYLIQEQQLGLVGNIKAGIEAMDLHREKLEQAIEAENLEGFRHYLQSIDRHFRNLTQEIRGSRQAVYRLAEKAKTQDKDLPIRERYARVLDAWDEFVTPLNQMARPGELFDRAQSVLESNMRSWQQSRSIRILVQDAERDMLHGVVYRLLDFRDALPQVLADMERILYPLVKQARLNTNITRGANLALKALEPSIQSKSSANQKVIDWGLAIKSGNKDSRPDRSDALVAFLFNLDPSKPRVENRLPSLEERSESRARKVVPVQKILRKLGAAGPVDDVMAWIQEHFPEANLVEALSATMKIRHDPRLQDREITGDREHYIFGHRVIGMTRRGLQ
ncbi:hypothetical protein [Alcanivorax sp. NBRC 102024]|uniref:hypothetical protein n=1 Tax=Alcanivorax sp. NBRC 102024 TaxID=1113895 RepID=UPI000789C532|nr:hypothetical protein [Alcanivorax sp. NBRC 102024]